MKLTGAGILGGSFNPVHSGHVKLGEVIQAKFGFAPLYVVPAKNPPHKPPYEIADKDRLAMVRLGFAKVQGAEVSTFELEADGPSYAIRTIEHFKQKHPGQDLTFILGADAFHDLPNWYEFPKVMEACNYIVVARAGWEEVYEDEAFEGQAADDSSDTHFDEDEEQATKLGQRLALLAQSGLLREVPNTEPFSRLFKMRSGMHLGVLDVRLPEVSSTEVRLRLQLGETVADLVPSDVAQYLKTLNLYGTK